MIRSLPLWTIIPIVLLSSSTATAHELKALASQLWLSPKTNHTTAYLAWGHVLPVDELIVGKTLSKYALVSPNGKAKELPIEKRSLQAQRIELAKSGVYQVYATRKPTELTYVIDSQGDKRLKLGPKTAVKEGKIVSSFRSIQVAKALIVKAPTNATKVANLDLPLEIVPLDCPDAWLSGKALRFQVLFQGRPLAGEQVLATYVGFRPENAWCFATNTNREGVATVRPQRAGTWVLRVRYQQAAKGKLRDQFDHTHFTSTLTLEIRP